jgi:hypothetical protein
MATPVFQLTVQSLSNVVSGRAAETMLLSALRDLKFSPDTVTARDMQRVLSGPLERRLTQIMPGTATLDNLRAISRRLAQLDPKAPTLFDQNARTVIWDQEDGEDASWSDDESDPFAHAQPRTASLQPRTQQGLMGAPNDRRPGPDNNPEVNDSTASLLPASPLPRAAEPPFGNPASSAVLGRNPGPSVPVNAPAELKADFRADVFGDEDGKAASALAAAAPASPIEASPVEASPVEASPVKASPAPAPSTPVPVIPAPGAAPVKVQGADPEIAEAQTLNAEDDFSADDFEFSDPDYNHLQATTKRYDLTNALGQDALLYELARHAGVQTVVLCTTSGQVLNVRAPQGAPQLGSVVAATALLLRQRDLRLISANLGSATVCMRVVGNYCVALLARGDINVGRLLSELQQIEVAA